MPYWALWLVTVVIAVGIAVLVLWRVRRELSADDYPAALTYLVLSSIFGLIAWRLKGFSYLSYFVLVGTALAGIFLGTGGHPGRMFELWLNDDACRGRSSVGFQLRLVLVMILVCAAAMPLLLRLLYR